MHMSPAISGKSRIASSMPVMSSAIRGNQRCVVGVALRVYHLPYQVNRASDRRCPLCYLPYKAGQLRVVLLTLRVYHLSLQVYRTSHQAISDASHIACQKRQVNSASRVVTLRMHHLSTQVYRTPHQRCLSCCLPYKAD